MITAKNKIKTIRLKRILICNLKILKQAKIMIKLLIFVINIMKKKQLLATKK